MTIQSLDHVNFITEDLEKTCQFYKEIIGLELRSTPDKNQSIYFFLPGTKQAILHISHIDYKPNPKIFNRLAKINSDYQGDLKTGVIDHFCLRLDMTDYPIYFEKLTNNNIIFDYIDHGTHNLKQIWVIDPNGVRVELNFI